MSYLIDKIKNENNFCVSDVKKMPLNVKNYLQTLNIQDIKPVTKEDLLQHNLASLNEIDACASFDNTNRAYHMHASDNLIVGFDVEPRCSSNYLAYFAQLPAHYREYSMHNGIHLLYQLDRRKLISAAIEMLSNRTVHKFKGQVNNQPLEYEIMLNNHWLTLTRRTFGKQLELEQAIPDEIYQLINQIASDWRDHNHVIEAISVSSHVSETAKKIADLIDDSQVQKLKEFDISDFSDDDSLYEYNIALRIAGIFYNRLYVNPRPLDAMHLQENPSLTSKSDLVIATALELEKIVPKRKKDEEFREGIPWLQYIAKKACEYIIANN